MATKKSKKSLSPTQKVEIAVGLTAAAVAAAGTYFLYGSKDAAKNRKKVKSWMLSAKAEVLSTMEKAQHMSKAEYEQLIEGVAATYSSMKDASKGDVSAFKKEMKEYWGEIEKKGKKMAAGAIANAVKKAAKKPAKKATKKTAKKAAKKTVKKTAKKTTKKATKKKA